MRKYELRGIKRRLMAAGIAFAIGITMNMSIYDAHAEEEEGATEEFVTEDEYVIQELMETGSSKHPFIADGTDGQLPDDEWAVIEAKFQELKGQTMGCTAFASRALFNQAQCFSSSNAGPYLLANGYYQVGTKVDFTNGVTFKAEADATAAKMRRGDVLVFSNDAGVYTHVGIVCVDSDNIISMYHGGVYNGSASNIVDKTTLAWYLSGAKSENDGYGDNVEIYRKISNGDYSEKTEEEIAKEEELFNTTLAIRYNTHVQNIGWQNDVNNVKSWKHDGETAGTSGKSYRLEGITIKVTGNDKLGVAYNTHIQNIGWQNDVNDSTTWKHDGEMSGTSGKSYRLEAIQIKLTGEEAANYSVYYRVHAQNVGWLGWAKDGEFAGTRGLSYRLEAIEIVVLPKGQSPDGQTGGAYYEFGKGASNGETDGRVNYMTHVQDYGDQSYVYDGSVSGTSGESKRLEGIRIKLNNDKTGVTGGISYLTHVQNEGWQGDINDITTWKHDGEFSGTSGKSYRLEAIKIALTGEMAKRYDVYYRVHVQNFGWLDWASNGEIAGTTGYSYRLEGIQIKLVPKGGEAPGATARSYVIK